MPRVGNGREETASEERRRARLEPNTEIERLLASPPYTPQHKWAPSRNNTKRDTMTDSMASQQVHSHLAAPLSGILCRGSAGLGHDQEEVSWSMEASKRNSCHGDAPSQKIICSGIHACQDRETKPSAAEC
ncbi:hypothetical protein NDU88_000598 [Pleurodeles waltl]|uniref:Uncharacterized protein n=1 Tax=Pleurodeles waltl TaxID=8319 RepID=A0AAV7S5P7_PLEWA|nr:hypothetical protein NDU88_000598 [Pleurodeles waltl]